MTVEEWLGEDNELGIDIWKRKYQYEDETFDHWLDRVSGGNEDIKKLMIEKKFLFGGRILANRGLNHEGRKVSLSNCFTEDAKVVTKSGIRNIKDIHIGDKVLSHDGKFHAVNNVMCRDYQGDLYTFSGSNIGSTTCTPNHQILTKAGWRRIDDIAAHSCDQIKGIRQAKIIDKVPDINCNGEGYLADITDGYIETPTKRLLIDNDKVIRQVYCKNGKRTIWSKRGKWVNRYIHMDSDMMYFLGRWIGDGCVHKEKHRDEYSIMNIVFNLDSEWSAYEKCRTIGESHFGVTSTTQINESQRTICLTFYNEIIASWIQRNFGAFSWGKCVPDRFADNYNLLKGIIESDGCISADGSFTIVLCNYKIMEFIQNALLANGICYAPIKEFKQSLPNARKSWQISLNRNISAKFVSKDFRKYKDNRMDIIPYNSEKSIYCHIKNIYIKHDCSCKVYNLSVEDSHSYTVNGVVVHNCYVISPPEDSIESIFETSRKLARTYSYGGGCGIDISKLAPKGAKVRNAAKETSGAISFMDLFSLTTELIGQNGRRGALMISMSIDHPDIIDFITVKTDLEKVTKANISIRMTDDFMESVKAGKQYRLHYKREATGEVIEKMVNAKDIMNLIAACNYDYGEPGMLFWNNIENYNMLCNNIEFSYSGVNPCAEEPLPAGGSCLLGSINLSEFVMDPFTKYASFNIDKFIRCVRTCVKGLNEVLDEGLPLHPLQEQRDSVRDWRQIGLGIMGLADMLIKLGIKYGSEKCLKLCDKIGFEMANAAIDESSNLASEFVTYPKYTQAVVDTEYFHSNTTQSTLEDVVHNGLRNSQLLTIAPTGTLSTMLGISGGIEPIFSYSYTRKTESLFGEDKYYTVYAKIVQDYLKVHPEVNPEHLPDYFVDAMHLDYKQRVDTQATWQKHIDASISSTVNVPENFTVEDVENMYMYAWEKGCKGITLFRTNCKRAGILTPKTEENAETSNELKRGQIQQVNDDVIGRKRKLMTGCGTLHCEAFFDPKTGRLLETYLSKGSTGGCNNFMVGLSRMISLSARAGVDIDKIIDQLNSTGVCPSYAVRRATQKDTSKGSCCPMAVGNALRDMYNEVQESLNHTCDCQGKKCHHKDETSVEVTDMHTVADFINDEYHCPECGEELMFEGGCNICKNCGWSRCS